MNVELLQRVKQHILEEPLRLEMIVGLSFDEPGATRYPGYLYGGVLTKMQFPACGTIGCIAGWTCRLADPDWDQMGWQEIRNMAQSLLGITYWDAEGLFYLSGWNYDFKERYVLAATPLERAQITAERIDQFIAEKG